ncbi:hypothetical protein Y032_0162g3431 [Ancylostoma ceylanicum]|uniref:Uncharacterized protein n=1 Tax=Ancylostoma ceylanicum TaxID=53326 RepID=A0A016SXN0_9BILA|nr:hypothetical protein Y032_0162g3431 [Ancylostoma ceylanicum]
MQMAKESVGNTFYGCLAISKARLCDFKMNQNEPAIYEIRIVEMIRIDRHVTSPWIAAKRSSSPVIS